MRTLLSRCSFAAVLLSGAAHSFATIPDLSHCYAVTAATEPVSVYVVPNGGGDPLTLAFGFGGTRIDATITLFMLDINDNPIPYYPQEDIWLESDGDFVFCPAGTLADGNTDANGITHFTQPLQAGGASQPEGGWGTMVMISGQALEQPGFEIDFNSADINGDLAVNLSDLVLLAQDREGSYQYRSDLYWDGAINLSDVVLLARGYGADCP
jgi:hypothetical protein